MSELEQKPPSATNLESATRGPAELLDPRQTMTMQYFPKKRDRQNRRCVCCCLIMMVGVTIATATGCQDGPLYALKAGNPYFVLKEWKDDELIGVTDHQRRKEMLHLASSIESMSDERQAFWTPHLEQVMKNDQSVEMRRLAVAAAGKIRDGSGRGVIKQGLKDESTKIRMEACKSLADLHDEDSLLLLAETLGSETTLDVKHVAMESLGKFDSPIATNALRSTLTERNPATQRLAIKSLRSSTGKNYGDDPQVWIAALDGKEVPTAEVHIADRIREFF